MKKWFKRYPMKDWQFFIEGQKTGRREVIGIRSNSREDSAMDALYTFRRMYQEDGRILGDREA